MHKPSLHPKTHVVGEQTLCSNCGHIESAHLEPRVAVGSPIRQFPDAGELGNVPTGSSSSTTKATQSKAETETSGGLRKNRKSETDTEPPSMTANTKSTKRQKGDDVQEDVNTNSLHHISASVSKWFHWK
ncbi:hypothetical protein B0H13DRAFT_1851209 [Mycena leptocephala]|nr:hypothetical protein B0H13DRAFT_1851209 [Mycena leptocephala]